MDRVPPPLPGEEDDARASHCAGSHSEWQKEPPYIRIGSPSCPVIGDLGSACCAEDCGMKKLQPWGTISCSEQWWAGEQSRGRADAGSIQNPTTSSSFSREHHCSRSSSEYIRKTRARSTGDEHAMIMATTPSLQFTKEASADGLILSPLSMETMSPSLRTHCSSANDSSHQPIKTESFDTRQTLETPPTKVRVASAASDATTIATGLSPVVGRLQHSSTVESSCEGFQIVREIDERERPERLKLKVVQTERELVDEEDIVAQAIKRLRPLSCGNATQKRKPSITAKYDNEGYTCPKGGTFGRWRSDRCLRGDSTGTFSDMALEAVPSQSSEVDLSIGRGGVKPSTAGGGGWEGNELVLEVIRLARSVVKVRGVC